MESYVLYGSLLAFYTTPHESNVFTYLKVWFKSGVSHEILVAADFNPPKTKKCFKSRRDEIFLAQYLKYIVPAELQNLIRLTAD